MALQTAEEAGLHELAADLIRWRGHLANNAGGSDAQTLFTDAQSRYKMLNIVSKEMDTALLLLQMQNPDDPIMQAQSWLQVATEKQLLHEQAKCWDAIGDGRRMDESFCCASVLPLRS